VALQDENIDRSL